MSLADMLNAPREFVVGGVKLEARRVTLFDIYRAVSDALVAEGSKNKSQSLQKEVQERIESGAVPPGCYGALLKAALKPDMPEITDVDIAALLTPNLMNDAIAIVIHAIGSDGDEDEDEQPADADAKPGKKKKQKK